MMQADSAKVDPFKLAVTYIALPIFLLIFGMFLWYELTMPAEPALVDMLRSGARTDLPAKMEVLYLRGDRPFTKAKYDQLDRVPIESTQAQRAILDCVRADSRRGRKHLNHPWTVHEGILRIEYSPTEVYYVYYNVLADNDSAEPVAELSALPPNTHDPNHGRTYYNRRLHQVMAQHTPWQQRLSNVSWSGASDPKRQQPRK